MLKFRPLAQPKYRSALNQMDVAHGSEYDCQREVCSVCQPYRDLERAYYLSLSDEDKKLVHFWSFSK